MAPRILVVDDDPDILHLIHMRLSSVGHEVVRAASGEEGLAMFRERRPQLVITDLRMGEMDGMALFSHLQAEAPLVPVIVLTAHGTIPAAVEATQRGVFSFLTKPYDSQELLRRVADALRLSPVLDQEDANAEWRRTFITANLRLEETLRQAHRIGQEQRTALILGPQGAGKRTLAQAIHQASPHAGGPFQVLACTEYCAEDLEARFIPGVDNILEQASGGVLYIQDIGAMPLPVQARLHAFLVARTQGSDPLRRIHAPGTAPALPAVQVIAATSRSLQSATTEGSFRSDLYYILSGGMLQLPALGERADDIPLLARHFLHATAANCRPSPEALAALQEASWPGNVRQLRNVLEQAAMMTPGASIGELTIRRIIRESDEAALIAFDDARRDFERAYLVRLLQATAGNVSQAARVAQRNRTEFYKLLARHGLDPVCFKENLK